MVIGMRTTTAEQLLVANLPRCELIGGEIVMMSPAGFDHGRLASKIVGALENHVAPRRLGVVTTAEAGFQIAHNPDTVRVPDVAFVRADRIPAGRGQRVLSGVAGPGRGGRFANGPRRRSGSEGPNMARGRFCDGLDCRSREADHYSPS